MKKLFALVLVVAMALAIALPALAATGWDKPEVDPEEHDDFAMTAQKYEWYSSSSSGYGADGNYFADWDDKKGVVKDTLGRAYFTVTLPTAADAAALYPGVDFSNLSVSIKITNVKAVQEIDLTAGTVDYAPTLSTSITGFDAAKKLFSGTKTPPALTTAAQTVKYMYVFRAADAANVVATISITAGDDTLPATFLKGTTTITAATPSANEYTFTVTATDLMTFTTNASTDKIEHVYLTSGADKYEVLVGIGGAISFKLQGSSDPALQSGTVYDGLKARYDFFMGALGFAWDGTAKFMTEDLIIDNLIKHASGSASVTFPGGYQSITDPSVNPPQTGDATTVVGFVMIALALVAAAAVTVKKVRA